MKLVTFVAGEIPERVKDFDTGNVLGPLYPQRHRFERTT